jgi:hypothetical protein
MFLKHEMNDNELLISTTMYILLNLCFMTIILNLTDEYYNF